MFKFRLLPALAALLVIMAVKPTPAHNAEYVTTKGNEFVMATSGRSFTPWGNDAGFDFKSPNWGQAKAYYKYLKSIHTNTLRIMLPFTAFMDGPAPGTPNTARLKNLVGLINLADSLDMRLDLTGLADFRPNSTPAWYDNAPESERWADQAAFWKAVATAADSAQGRNAILDYDLMNEPVVNGTNPITTVSNSRPIIITTKYKISFMPGERVTIVGVIGNSAANGTWNVTTVSPNSFSLNGSTGNGAYAGGGTVSKGWYTGLFGGAVFNEYLTLTPGTRTNPDIAVAWIKTLSTAVRQSDKTHMITVGSLPSDLGFGGLAPAATAPYLDFLCTHIYPDSGKSDAAIANCKNSAVGKPIIVEETGDQACGIDTLSRFLVRSDIKNGGTAAGFIGHSGGRTIEEWAKALRMGTLTITDASNTNPIVITTNKPHNLFPGMSVEVANVGGTTAANGTWRTRVVGPNALSLIGSSGNGSFAGGGTVALPFGELISGIFTETWLLLSNSVQDTDFENPPVGDGPAAFTYAVGGMPWAFTKLSGENAAGVSGNGSALTGGNPNAPDGYQVAFVRGLGSFTQQFYFAQGQRYQIAFKAAQRANVSQTSQSITVSVGSVQVGSVTPTGARYDRYTTEAFDIGTKASGFYDLTFTGRSTNSTAFIDSVEIVPQP